MSIKVSVASLLTGTAFLAGMCVAAMTVLPSMSALEGALTCLIEECADLAAQRSMALAAWAMVGLTIVATIVGGLSLALIYWTLDAARRSAVAAEKSLDLSRNVGIAQTRGYVTISLVGVSLEPPVLIVLRLKNSGTTPAYDLRLVTDSHVKRIRSGTAYATGGALVFLPDLASGDHKDIQTTTYFNPNKEIRDGTTRFNLKVDITYTDIYGEVHQSLVEFGAEIGESDTFSLHRTSNSSSRTYPDPKFFRR